MGDGAAGSGGDPPLAGIILAGGASSRMGSDKRRLRVGAPDGPTLLEHMLGLLAPWCDERIVVLNDPQGWPDLPARLVPDLVAGGGPLAGLAAGLVVAEAPWALVLACDMPLVRPPLLARLLSLRAGYDAVVPLRHDHADGGGPRNTRAAEPLLALYARGCLPVVQGCLDRGERRMVAPLDRLRVRYVEPDAWRADDPGGQSFLNLNRPEDLELLAQIDLAGGLRLFR
jgi:molybdopterin-guanine dinucleotide biosynthesis protein A